MFTTVHKGVPDESRIIILVFLNLEDKNQYNYTTVLTLAVQTQFQYIAN